MDALEVLHVDNHVLAVRKPAGMPCVPDASGDESLFDRARDWIERRYDKPGRAFLGVVHRLDRPVSGVVVFGRTSKGAARLTAAFAEQRTAKLYWGIADAAAIPAGGPGRGELRQHLWKDRAKNRVLVSEAGRRDAKLAVTGWRLVERAAGTGGRHGAGRALHALRPATGRSHQLRVAMATLGRPLLGDLRYGPGPALEDRSVALHARALLVPHPTAGHRLLLVARPPELPVWEFECCAGARSGAHEVEAGDVAGALDVEALLERWGGAG